MTQDAAPVPPQDPVIATAGQYYRNMRYLMCVGLIAVGIWFGYDGFVGYPRINQQIADLQAQHDQAARSGDRVKAAQLLEQLQKLSPKTQMDMNIQKALAFILPPLGVLIVIRALYKSRGEFRAENQTLYAPGHPPVPFANITEIDRHLWDRKGIAYLSYDLGNGQQGTITLDDFVYDRPPIDEIYERIDRFVNGGASRLAVPEEPA